MPNFAQTAQNPPQKSFMILAQISGFLPCECKALAQKPPKRAKMCENAAKIEKIGRNSRVRARFRRISRARIFVENNFRKSRSKIIFATRSNYFRRKIS